MDNVLHLVHSPAHPGDNSKKKMNALKQIWSPYDTLSTPFFEEQTARFAGAQTKTFLLGLHVQTAYARAKNTYLK